jgi:hypothetical protein
MFNYESFFLNFYIISQKNILFLIKRFLEPIQPGVGSSGVAEMPRSPDMGCHIDARVLFTSPYSTPNLDKIRDTHRQASIQWSCSRGGDRDEDNDVVDMVSFPGVRCVTSTETLFCTFLVDDNVLQLKQIRLPSIFSYFNCFMLSISYTNHLDYYFKLMTISFCV